MQAKILSDLLDLFEQRESKLLSWGVTSGGFVEEEVDEIIDDYLRKNSSVERTITELKKDLVEHRFLFRLPTFEQDPPFLYRTRSAETIRLLDMLKQIISFQRITEQPANWRAAPNLVADYRYALRPRRFPVRCYTVQHVIERLQQNSLFVDGDRVILDTLLGPAGAPLILADFQVEAIVKMLGSTNDRREAATIVTAGTGSGKTYAFYLPALIHITREIGPKRRVIAMALYPRQELLKDQFSNAYKLLLKLADAVRHQKGRSISMGAYSGPVPYDEKSVLKELDKTGSRKWVCHFLKCPSCNQDLYWLRNDIENNRHVLRCLNQTCNHTTPHDDILCLTRERIKAKPPELLFTITESLNRLMCDAWYFHIVGVGHTEAPDLVLLDEVHTYTGIHGAHVAHLIKRWKAAVGKRMHFTGLSATLENATAFFSDMTGVASGNVAELKPVNTEPLGMEYLLALRGDPVSGTSLLSTTIQTTMLLRRVLETDAYPGIALYGKKVFAFTDDLDVTNRLYHNLLDAEGYTTGIGGRVQGNRLPLAVYRKQAIAGDSEPDRYRHGQSWRISEVIGHRLNDRLRIGRTSSQDAGVAFNADVVIATASLEVGYDDDQVGAVIQHKTPRDIASFLQRKGRAGRAPWMRPWTIITLSDYGRDRITYQSYEQLFSPVLPERNLPIRNRYVQKIQSTFILFDWLTKKLYFQGVKAKLWNELIYRENVQASTSVQQRLLALLEDLLKVEQGENYLGFIRYLQQTMELTEEEVYSICWEEPRPVMAAVVPTLQRQLKNNWEQFGGGVEASSFPLPEFIPSNLFSDLNLPEVEVRIDGGGDENSNMSIEQALREFAPGRVSRRFAVHNMQESHWIAVSTEVGDQQVDINDWFARKDELGSFPYFDENGYQQFVMVYRPFTLRATMVDANVKPSSNSFLAWRTAINVATGWDGQFSATPSKTYWHPILPQIGFFTHQNGTPLAITRFAIAARANLNLREGDNLEISKSITFSSGNEAGACALGFRLSVDGLCLRVAVPSDLVERTLRNEVLMRGLRVSYFRYLLARRHSIAANSFQLDWLMQGVVASLTLEVAREKIPIEEAFARICNEGFGQRIMHVFNVLFSVDGTGDNDEERQRNHDRLVVLCGDETVLEQLIACIPCLWQQPDPDFAPWLINCFLSTLNAALLETIYQLTPNFTSTEVVVDIEAGQSAVISDLSGDGFGGKIWITEKTMGSGGVIETIARLYTENPQQFFVLLESAIQASDFELADSQLQAVLRLIRDGDARIIDSIEDVRSASGHKALDAAHSALHKALQQKGILTINTFYAALNVRILRAGSSEHSDELIMALLDDWKELEQTLGLDVEARLYAYIASQQEEFQQRVRELVPVTNVFSVIYGLLWPRGHLLRTNAMKVYSPFQNFQPSDRLLLTGFVQQREVRISDADWLGNVHQLLSQSAEVALRGSKQETEQLKSAILLLQTTPLELGVLFLYPQVSGISYDQEQISVKITLPENAY